MSGKDSNRTRRDRSTQLLTFLSSPTVNHTAVTSTKTRHSTSTITQRSTSTITQLSTSTITQLSTSTIHDYLTSVVTAACSPSSSSAASVPSSSPSSPSSSTPTLTCNVRVGPSGVQNAYLNQQVPINVQPTEQDCHDFCNNPLIPCVAYSFDILLGNCAVYTASVADMGIQSTGGHVIFSDKDCVPG